MVWNYQKNDKPYMGIWWVLQNSCCKNNAVSNHRRQIKLLLNLFMSCWSYWIIVFAIVHSIGDKTRYSTSKSRSLKESELYFISVVSQFWSDQFSHWDGFSLIHKSRICASNFTYNILSTYVVLQLTVKLNMFVCNLIYKSHLLIH